MAPENPDNDGPKKGEPGGSEKIEPELGPKPEANSDQDPSGGEDGEEWYEASAQEEDPPLEEIPDLNDDELKSDTLEFEQVSRRRPQKKGGLKWIILVLVASGGAYAAWDKWGDELIGRKPDELPLVRAAEGPMKVRPEQPGGIDIPNRDKLVYDRLEKKPPEAGTENLLPRPEVPLPPPKEKPQDKAEVTPQPEDKVQASQQSGSASPNTPDKTEAGGSKAVDSVTESPTVKKSAPPTVEEVKAASKPDPAPAPPPVKKPEPVKTEPAGVAAKTNAKAPAAAKTSAGSGYQIQLAAVRQQDAAKREWQRLSKKHANLLGSLSLNVVRADLGKKGIFYRLRAGPLADLASAKTLCQALVKQKVGCLVIRPKK